jgi:hypothetical protein
MKRILQSVAVSLIPTAVLGQTADAPPVLTEAQEIALARSAAPPEVSADATVLLLRDGRYVAATRGSSGVTCMVSRSLPLSLEPICYDPEASRTILPMEIARVEMRLGGVPLDEVERRLESMIEVGELALPDRPAMAYMMSSSQVLYADADTRVGSWMPHIHLYVPHATAEDFGASAGRSAPPVWEVVDAGEPTANLVIKVRDFVDPEPEQRPEG